MWYLNRLNATYINEIIVPVRIEGVYASGERFSNEYFNVECRVRGNGYAILLGRLFPRAKSITLSAGDVVITRREGDTFYNINIGSLERAIASRLKGLELLSVLDNAVRVDAVNYAEKMLPVVPDITLNLRGQYMQVGKTVIEPCSVLMKGDAAVLERLNAVYTQEKSIKSLRNDLVGIIDLVPVESVSSSVKNVRYEIQVEQYTEVRFTKPVEVVDARKNNGEATGFTVIPASVTVIFNVAKNYYNDFKKENVGFFVEYDGDSPEVPGREHEYEVKVKGLSPGVQIVSVEPAYVAVFENSVTK